MNKNQLKYYRMFIASKNSLDDNNTVWSGNPKFSETKNLLEIEIQGIENLSDEVSKTTKGETRDKNQIRKSLENKLLPLSGVLAAHAALTNSEGLKTILITAKSNIEGLKETDLVTYSNTITSKAEELQEILSAEYGVTASEIEDIKTNTNEFKPLIGSAKPKQAAINAAKRTLSEHVDEANRLLKEVVDKLMLRYQATNTQFYNEYQQSRTIVD